MSEFLFHYHRVSPTTWVYLSSLLMIGLYFKFGRLWSVRNLDLVLLILLAPGLLLAQFGSEMRRSATATVELETADIPGKQLPVNDDRLGSAADSSETDVVAVDAGIGGAAEDLAEAEQPSAEVVETEVSPEQSETGPSAPFAAAETVISSEMKQGRFVERLGYVWLFVAGVLLLVRLMIDPMMVRRPLLPPNLSVGGLTFIGCSLIVFLTANVVASKPGNAEAATAVAEQATVAARGLAMDIGVSDQGPGYALLNVFPHKMNKTLAVLSQLSIVLGVVLIGYWHFDNTTTGIGSATLYLMLPYTALMTGRVDHVLPAALLTWCILYYRRPLVAGMFLGFASGVVYYPLFLLPLWLSFYWQRGLVRFLVGFVLTLATLSFLLVLASSDILADLQRMFGLWKPLMGGLGGVWNSEIGGWDPVFRLPFLAAFLAIALSFALWPPQKNLGTLLSCSAALMVATQFWHGYGGGTYMAWYLPLVLLTVFRPNLEDRVALAVLGEGWLPRRRAQVASVDRAA